MNFETFAPRAARAEAFLKALANRHRLMVLCELREGERSVTALQRRIGLSQSSLSQHLARLRQDGLVETRRESQTIFYSLAKANVSRLIALLYDLDRAEDCGSAEGEARRRGASTAPSDGGWR